MCVGLPSAAAADHRGASLLRPSSEISKDDEGGKSTFVFSNLSSWYSPLYPIASTSPYKTRRTIGLPVTAIWLDGFGVWTGK